MILHFDIDLSYMKKAILILLTVACVAACGRKEEPKPHKRSFTNLVVLKTTPVKDQGKSSLCWAYAMLATIETEHLMLGDSVNLSADYVGQMFLREQANLRYMTQGKQEISTRGMGSMLIHLILRHGAMPFDSYRPSDGVDYDALARKLQQRTDAAAAHYEGLQKLNEDITELFNTEVCPTPRFVFMYGCEYTVQEFANSICREDEYVALTSFSHHPYGSSFVLEVPDNYYRDEFLNLPIDTLVQYVEHALQTGHPVCWEGDTSEMLFSFASGTAEVDNENETVTQEMRQEEFERFKTTDDHCMEIIGLARDKNGRKYFICKNSWGTGNPYGGMMYMSENYLRCKTIAVFMPRVALPR